MKNGISWPNYSKNILGIPNSFLKHYNAKAPHVTLPLLDALLAKNYTNVVFMIFDGMGSDMLRANLPPDAFLNRHIADELSSVYPCTTTAAITAFESGLSPIEHGWLGWSCYFKEIGKRVDLFTSNDAATGQPAADVHMAHTYMPYISIFDKIKQASPEAAVFNVSPFSEYYADTTADVCTQIRQICQKPGRKYIHAYHHRPDCDMHDHGCYAEPVKQLMRHINDQIERLSNTLQDAIIVITADHGLINSTDVHLDEYPDLFECLAIPPSVESRCLSFFVKDGMFETFATRFNAQFGSDFLLLTKAEALSRNIFGTGTPHPKALDFIGDYVALATGNLRLISGANPHHFKAMHAGLTAQEMLVPLIIIEKEKRP